MYAPGIEIKLQYKHTNTSWHVAYLPDRWSRSHVSRVETQVKMDDNILLANYAQQNGWWSPPLVNTDFLKPHRQPVAAEPVTVPSTICCSVACRGQRSQRQCDSIRWSINSIVLSKFLWLLCKNQSYICLFSLSQTNTASVSLLVYPPDSTFFLCS